MTFHPKTSAAAVGAALGVVIVSVLTSFHSVHLTPDAQAAIPTFLSVFFSWWVPVDATVAPKPGPQIAAETDREGIIP